MAFYANQLRVFIGGETYDTDITSFAVAAAKKTGNEATIAESRTGGANKYEVQITALQDPRTGTLFDLMWSSAGTKVVYIVGNFDEEPSTTNYYLTGEMTLKEPNGVFLGGDVEVEDPSRFTFDIVCPSTARPTKITDPDDLPTP